MSLAPSPTAASELRKPLRTAARGLLRLRHETVLPALIILGLLVLLALTANLLPLPDPKSADLAASLLPPFHSSVHPLGTDPIGRDILSRVVFGTRISLTVGFTSVAIAAVFGVIVGLLAGYHQGWVDIVFMRFGDIQLSLPSFILALTIMTIFGAGEKNVILALSIAGWVRYARVVRSNVLPLHEAEYVLAERALGCGSLRIMFRHILPNVISPVIVVATLGLGANIISEAGLSFLGLGVDPQTPSWGIMLANGRDYLEIAPWVALVPGVAISLTVLATNLVGDWLRDVLDPRGELQEAVDASPLVVEDTDTDSPSELPYEAVGA